MPAINTTQKHSLPILDKGLKNRAAFVFFPFLYFLFVYLSLFPHASTIIFIIPIKSFISTEPPYFGHSVFSFVSYKSFGVRFSLFYFLFYLFILLLLLFVLIIIIIFFYFFGGRYQQSDFRYGRYCQGLLFNVYILQWHILL